ncbi:MAG: molybdopterin dinucleotide binding domain-containing protein, partial [Chloroflexota bacterium]|nr:molybdopterin dinucleotide binding domain-containing protein [Chloroflexota bacterium]
ETETAAFWKRRGAEPSKINTEVFLLPAAASFEKEGSVTNSGRWAQWRQQCAAPPGEAKRDLWIVNELVLRLKDLYSKEGGPNAQAITQLTWDYGNPPDVHRVAREINGYDLKTGKLMASFAALADDGTTSCGNWLYCASYTEAGNMMARRNPKDTSGIGLYSQWAWCWPLNRRIIYNRASVDTKGEPWDPRRAVIRWDGEKKAWVGDVVDGGGAPGSVYPFIMKPEGVARIFGMGLADGPFPEHYEPWESPVVNLLTGQQCNPVFKVFGSEMDFKGEADRFPIVATTYRVSEHWQAGAMTRNLPWLVELVPEMFVEMSPELAEEKGIRNGDRVVVETARGRVQGVAIVTARFRPFHINGRVVHELGLPWHWGYSGLSTGDSANLLTPHVGDANTMIPEYKAFLCDVRKV